MKVCIANRNIGQSFFQYILVFYPLCLFLTALAVRVSLLSIFSVLTKLLIQVFKRSGTTHRFVAVILQICIIFFLMALLQQLFNWSSFQIELEYQNKEIRQKEV